MCCRVLFGLVEDIESLEDSAKRRFGVAVRSYRLARSLTQEALAARATELGSPMTQTTIAKIERGDRPTPVGEAAVFAQIFGVTLQDLVPPDAATREASRKAEAAAECRRLIQEIRDDQALLTDAARRIMAARDDLRIWAHALGIDMDSASQADFNSLPKGVHFAIKFTDPVELTRKVKSSYEASRESRMTPAEMLEWLGWDD
jgi:transcriptional regulator with XRE-family HTH domain